MNPDRCKSELEEQEKLAKDKKAKEFKKKRKVG